VGPREQETPEAHKMDASDADHLSTMLKEAKSRPLTVGLTICSRKADEDRAFVESEGRVLAVFDGHRGAAMADFAAGTFLSELQNEARGKGVKWEGSDENPGWALVASEKDAHAILGAAFKSCHEAARRRKKRGGTTAVVFWSCLVNGRRTGFCANAGDSRAVVRCLFFPHRPFSPPTHPRQSPQRMLTSVLCGLLFIM
jgi:hypothetical protein